MIDKQTVLSLTNGGLNVFRHYFGNGISTRRKFRNPFYEDTHPSCSLYFDSQRGIYKYKDFGNEDYSGDCFDLVATLHNLSCRNTENFIEILRIIDREFQLHELQLLIDSVQSSKFVTQKMAKELTDKPFGVNVMLMSPYADDVAKVVVEEGIKVVTTGAGIPGKYMGMWKEAGIKVIPVVASVAQARLMEKSGADAVVAEGMESGGHIGEATTMTLVPQVVDAVSIPVIAAGGIVDGRGMAAAFMLGAEAVQMGTRFVASKEAVVHENYKQLVIKAKDIDTRVTGRTTGHPVRAIRNEMTRHYLELEKEGAPFEELEKLTLGGLRRAVVDGDVKTGSVMSGQIAGMVKDEKSCKEIIEQMMNEMEELLKGAPARL